MVAKQDLLPLLFHTCISNVNLPLLENHLEKFSIGLFLIMVLVALLLIHILYLSQFPFGFHFTSDSFNVW